MNAAQVRSNLDAFWEARRDLRARVERTAQRRYEQLIQGLLVGNAAGVALIGSILGGLAASAGQEAMPITLVVCITFYVFGAGSAFGLMVGRFIGVGYRGEQELMSHRDRKVSGDRFDRLIAWQKSFFEAAEVARRVSAAMLVSATVMALIWLWMAATM